MKQAGIWAAEVTIVVFFVGCLSAILAPLFMQENEPKLTLEAKEWSCQKTEPRRHSYLTMIGKVPVTNYSTRDECVEWKRVDE